MNCSCPKCSAKIEIDISLVYEKSAGIRCVECNKHFWIYKESFGGRALKKCGEIYCVKCGSELNHTVACPSCGTLYPDYLVVQTSRVTRKRVPVNKSWVSFDRHRPHKYKPRDNASVVLKKTRGKSICIAQNYSQSGWFRRIGHRMCNIF